ncbi:MAG TPA: hypothetical protein G4O13_08030 [Dehalococcoidia bacterium]|nr:hypothetical protein [Dehalococcoidia bacterium]
MNPIYRVFGRVCENCPVCNLARENPNGMLYKIMNSPLHGSWCPAWKGYKKLEAEGQLKRQQGERANNTRS